MSDSDRDHGTAPSPIDIAREHFLQGVTFKELGARYFLSASTINRRLSKWMGEGRFDIVDLHEPTRSVVEGIDVSLGEQLAAKTKIGKAKVVDITGVAAAYQAQHFADSTAQSALLAYRAGDELHRGLGEVAGEYVMYHLRRDSVVGVTPGRGAGFTINEFLRLAAETPSWVKSLDNISVVSLCASGHVGTWSMPNIRSLNADENAFVLAEVIPGGQARARYFGGWFEEENTYDALPHLDLAIVGLGQVNSYHHLLRDYQEGRFGAAAEPINTLKRLHHDHPHLINSVAEIAHRLFIVNEQSIAPAIRGQLRDVLASIDSKIQAAPSDIMKDADEILLVGGGAQKVEAISSLVLGTCLGAPIEPHKVTLVTDAWTAVEILKRA